VTWLTIKPTGHQAESWFIYIPHTVKMDDSEAKLKRPARFFWWTFQSPSIYSLKA